ncbi:MAG: 3-dehydroquinate synthase [Pseudomonadota bacterium]
MTASTDLKTVTVNLAERTYEIVIGDGLLGEAGAYLDPLLRRRRVFIISDKTVFDAQGERLTAGLDTAGIEAPTKILAPGEASKSFAVLEETLGWLLDQGADRGDLIIAFGGGVIGDLTGFAAAILRRGCRFIQLPTTLLAQVDSAVGGKTAVNAPQGKNLIGAFHQPVLVLADTQTLDTLPDRQRRAGYAEIVKYGAIGDADFFDWLEANGACVLGGARDPQARAIEVSCRAKAAIVAEDEREGGKRALLNLGHTFGHALEAAYGFSERLLHGEAVAAGMAMAFDYSAARGHCPQDAAARLKSHLASVGLPAGYRDVRALAGEIDGFDAAAMRDLMMQDKKIDAGALTLVLARGIGAAYIEPATDTDRLKAFLHTSIGA